MHIWRNAFGASAVFLRRQAASEVVNAFGDELGHDLAAGDIAAAFLEFHDKRRELVAGQKQLPGRLCVIGIDAIARLKSVVNFADHMSIGPHPCGNDPVAAGHLAGCRAKFHRGN